MERTHEQCVTMGLIADKERACNHGGRKRSDSRVGRGRSGFVLLYDFAYHIQEGEIDRCSCILTRVADITHW